MAEGGGTAGGGASSSYTLSATLELRDQLSGKLRSTASQLKSLNGAVSKLGGNGEVAKLAKQFDSLNDLRRQVEQFKQMKKSVAATKQAYDQANNATAQLAQQYRQGQSTVAQLQAKHNELKRTFDVSQSATAKLQDKLGGLKAEAAKAKTGGAVEEYKRLQNQIKATSNELKASQAMTRSTGAELKTLASGVKQAQRELNNIGKAFEQSKSRARDLKRELTTSQPELSRMRQSLAAQGFDTRDFVNSDRRLRQRTADTAQRLYTEQRLENLRSTLAAAGMTVPNQNGQLRLNVNGNATSTLGKIKNQLTSLTQKAWNVTVNAKNAIGGKISEFTDGALMGMGAQVLGTAGIGYGVVSAIQSQMEFEKQMSAVQAIIGYDKLDMEALVAKAEEIGATTKFTAAQAAQAMYYQGMAGWNEEQMLSGTRGIVNLAAAGNLDLGRTSDVVTDLMTAYQLRAGSEIKLEGKPIQEASAFFADSMAALITNANTDIEQAYEAMKYSAPTISAMYADRSIEEKAQAMQDAFIITGLMASGGVKGSQAGTSQRALFTRLASENRNAYFAERALPVSLVDETTGEVRRLRDVVGDFREKFQNGLDVDEVTRFAEEISGEKIHADTRRKLNSFIENVQKNGGKMTGADKLKLTSMLSGQEAMSGWLNVFLASEEDWKKMEAAMENAAGKAQNMADIQLDNLAGDITMLGSAWDAFQRNLVKGDASAGLREFTQGLTGLLTTANNLFKDGIQITDFVKIGADAITRLKNKFLELDGIGSLLAGGALFMAMKKLLSMSLSVKDALSAWSKVRTMNDVGSMIRNNRSVGTVTSSVGTMHVNAGVVNINGRVAGGRNSATTVATSGSGGRNSTSGGRAISGGTGGVMAASGARTATGSAVSRFAGTGSAAAGAGIITALFAAMDVLSTRTINEGRISEVQATYDENKKIYDETKAAYDEIANDVNRQDELPQASIDLQNATQNLEQSSEDLKAIQKETVKNNNESFFGGAGAIAGATAGAAIGSIIPVAGTAVGAVAGMILGTLGAISGSIIGKEIGSNFDFDVLGWMKGDSDKTTVAEKPVPVADWVTDSGKKYSELSTTEKIQYQQHESETERVRRESAESEVTKHVVDQKHDENMQRWQQGEFGDVALSNVTKDEIDAGIVEANRKKELKYTDFTHAAAFQPQPVVTSMYDTEQAKDAMSVTTKSIGDSISEKFESRSDYSSFFNPNFSQSNVTATQYDSENVKDFAETTQNNSVQERINALADNRINFLQPFSGQSSFATTQYNSESAKNVIETRNSETLQNIKEQFSSFNKDYSNFVKPYSEQSSVVANQYDTESVRSANESARQTESANNDVSILASIGNFLDGLLFNKAAANAITPETNMEMSTPVKPVASSEMADTSSMLSEMLPDFNISEWFSEKMADLDITTLGESFSGITESISTSLSETFSGITENVSMVATTIGESFSQIPMAASTAFSEIATAANEGWTAIQSTWSQVPSFFEGLWAGAETAASSAGSAIYSGLTSVIGGIIGAWQSAAGTISGIISSISEMASSAASMLPSFGGVGSNATGTASWRGGFTEINEQGGEIIDLPRGTRIYPHATTMKLLQRDIDNGKLNIGGSKLNIDIGHNATGTFSWRGGLTEVNERGGEIIDLPSGDRIYPKSTIMKLFQSTTADEYFSNSAQSNGIYLQDSSFSSQGNNFSSQSDFSTFPQAFRVDEILGDSIQNSSTTNNSTNNNGITISGNTFHVRKDTDINEIAFKLFELMLDSNANYAGA